VPEFFQDDVTGAALGDALLKQMADREQVAQLQAEFRNVHELLRRGGAGRAADAILEYVGAKPVAPNPGPSPAGGADPASVRGAPPPTVSPRDIPRQ
jgi:hypothetical protein